MTNTIQHAVITLLLLRVKLLIAISICKCFAGLRLPNVSANTTSTDMNFILGVLRGANSRPTLGPLTKYQKKFTKSFGVLNCIL